MYQVHYTYHSNMDIFLEQFAAGSLRRALVVARVVSAGLLYVETSHEFEVIDGGEIPAAGAPPDLAWHAQLAQQRWRATRLYTSDVLRRSDFQQRYSLDLRFRCFRFFYNCRKNRFSC